MSESIIRAKGQTTIPLDIRGVIGGGPGTRLAWHVLNDGRLLIRVKNKSVLDLKATLIPLKGKHVAVESLKI